MHTIEFPYEVSREYADLYLNAVIIVKKIKVPAEVKIVTPHWSFVSKINNLYHCSSRVNSLGAERGQSGDRMQGNA